MEKIWILSGALTRLDGALMEMSEIHVPKMFVSRETVGVLSSRSQPYDRPEAVRWLWRASEPSVSRETVATLLIGLRPSESTGGTCRLH